MTTEDPIKWRVTARVVLKGRTRDVEFGLVKYMSPLEAAERAYRELYQLGVRSEDVQSMHIDRA